MIKLVFISGAIMLSCGPLKTSQSVEKTDSVIVTAPVNQPVKDSLPTQKPVNKTPVINNTALPTCIKNKIDSFKLKEQHEKPQRVVEYIYRGKKVYYVVMPCCDFFNEVYDANCKLLGSPDGGFTGKGDGKLPDFFSGAKNEKLIWGSAK